MACKDLNKFNRGTFSIDRLQVLHGTVFRIRDTALIPNWAVKLAPYKVLAWWHHPTNQVYFLIHHNLSFFSKLFLLQFDLETALFCKSPPYQYTSRKDCERFGNDIAVIRIVLKGVKQRHFFSKATNFLLTSSGNQYSPNQEALADLRQLNRTLSLETSSFLI